MNSIFRRKPVGMLIDETKGKQGLKKALGAFDLTMLGIGCIIGTGIFVLTGVAAAKYSGPALVLSFVLAGLACCFAALCYSEFAAMIPVAGSAYTYGYAGLGEIWGWIIGWDLILEYAVGIATVAIGWSGYMVNLLNNIGIHLPKAITTSPFEHGVINVPAMLIIGLIALLLISGVRNTSGVNGVIVVIKVVVVLLFILLAFSHVNPANWHPFMPFGFNGVVSGAAVVFFSYIGFDAVSTAAEETRNPQKDMPKGIIASLLICTVLYIIVSAILTGILKYTAYATPVGSAAPVAYALDQIGIHWGAALVSVGAICGITSVCLVLMYGQSRIFFAMARDGLMPKIFGSVDPKHQTPALSTTIVAVVCAITAGIFPIQIVSELVSIGTLVAFIIVSAGIIVLRRKQPDMNRPFKVPFFPVTPILGILTCAYLIYGLNYLTWIRFIVWFAIGMIIYFAYGRSHSLLHKQETAGNVEVTH
ncbi:MAG: amino acid permease [Sporolactobacillus sp.]|jgi:APA family basic amino acid/polyamine antiporter|nr:amino acid permease [Sporolactobacillus sp.]MCI1883084.1 amino acid permease [Sporolactobacillus sp.]